MRQRAANSGWIKFRTFNFVRGRLQEQAEVRGIDRAFKLILKFKITHLLKNVILQTNNNEIMRKKVKTKALYIVANYF